MPKKSSPYKNHSITIDEITYNRLKKYSELSGTPMKKIIEVAARLLLERLEKDAMEIIYEKKATLRKKKEKLSHDPEK